MNNFGMQAYIKAHLPKEVIAVVIEILLTMCIQKLKKLRTTVPTAFFATNNSGSTSAHVIEHELKSLPTNHAR